MNLKLVVTFIMLSIVSFSFVNASVQYNDPNLPKIITSPSQASSSTTTGSSFNSTYNNLLGQNCPNGQVFNGTYTNGSFSCITDQSGGGGGSGNITGGGANPRVAFWGNATTLSSDPIFIFNSSSGRVGIGVGGNPITPLEIAGNTSGSSAKFGALEIQSFGVNNNWYADNIYYDGANMRYRSNGYGIWNYFYNGDWRVYGAPGGTAGAIAPQNILFSVKNDGFVGVGTTNPSNGKLDVRGNTYIQDNLLVNTTVSSNTFNLQGSSGLNGSTTLGAFNPIKTNFTTNLLSLGTDSVTAGFCSGTANDCSSFSSTASCNAQNGCLAVEGNSCNTFNGDQTTCEATTGCTWQAQSSCNDFNGDQTTCEATTGCTWNDPTCDGNYDVNLCNGNYFSACNDNPGATACDASPVNVNSASCNAQSGCTWTPEVITTSGGDSFYARGNALIEGPLKLGNATSSDYVVQGRKLEIHGEGVNPDSATSGLFGVFSTDPYSSDEGGSFCLGSVYTSSGDTICPAVMKGYRSTLGDGQADGGFKFYTRGGGTTEKMRLTPEGYLLVGATSNPSPGGSTPKLVVQQASDAKADIDCTGSNCFSAFTLSASGTTNTPYFEAQFRSSSTLTNNILGYNFNINGGPVLVNGWAMRSDGRISTTGNTPTFTGWTTLHSGNSTIAPLVIEQGTLTTTPVAGAIEANATGIFWSSNATSRYRLDQQSTSVSGDNSSWNQSLANTLYANISWNYNQSTLRQFCPAGQVVNGSYGNGTLVCVTAGSSFSNTNIAYLNNTQNFVANQEFSKNVTFNQTVIFNKSPTISGELLAENGIGLFSSSSIGWFAADAANYNIWSTDSAKHYKSEMIPTGFDLQVVNNTFTQDYILFALGESGKPAVGNTNATFTSYSSDFYGKNDSWIKSYVPFQFKRKVIFDEAPIGNGSLLTGVCLSNGTNCPATSGDNSTWNESRANTLYAPIKWNYNQTYTGGTYNSTYALWAYNQTYNGTTYNATYALWSYNQTYNASTYNTTYNLYAYNQTYTGGTFNATYALWSYNQTVPALNAINNTWNESRANTLYTPIIWSYNQSLVAQQCPVGKVVNGSFSNGTLSCITDTTSGGTYNATYDTWLGNYTLSNKFWYNMTLSAINTFASWGQNGTLLHINNITGFLYNYNQSDGSYNSTYALWSYNQTYNASTYNATYALWAYNQTIKNNGILLNISNITNIPNCANGQYLTNQTGTLSCVTMPSNITTYSVRADITTSTATFFNQTILMPMIANRNYTFDCALYGKAAAVTTGVQLNVSVPASPTFFGVAIDSGNGSMNGAVACSSTTNTCTNLVTSGSTTYIPMRINGRVENGANAGFINVSTKSEVGASLVTVGRLSYCKLTEEMYLQ